MAEKNAGEIMHMARNNDVYENVGWMCNLRGDRDSKLPPFQHSDKKFVAKNKLNAAKK